MPTRRIAAVVAGLLAGLILAGGASALEVGAMETNEQSPTYRYAKRAYFIIDRQGTVKWIKVNQNPLDLLKPEEVLQALKDSGA